MIRARNLALGLAVTLTAPLWFTLLLVGAVAIGLAFMAASWTDRANTIVTRQLRRARRNRNKRP